MNLVILAICINEHSGDIPAIVCILAFHISCILFIRMPINVKL